jgi:hypothetical protein
VPALISRTKITEKKGSDINAGTLAVSDYLPCTLRVITLAKFKAKDGDNGFIINSLI